MRFLLIGASGKAGSAIHPELSPRGHHMLTGGRSSGDLGFGVSTPTQLGPWWDATGTVNAVVSPAVFTESLADFGDHFPGFVPVEGAATRQVYTLP